MSRPISPAVAAAALLIGSFAYAESDASRRAPDEQSKPGRGRSNRNPRAEEKPEFKPRPRPVSSDDSQGEVRTADGHPGGGNSGGHGPGGRNGGDDTNGGNGRHGEGNSGNGWGNGGPRGRDSGGGTTVPASGNPHSATPVGRTPARPQPESNVHGGGSGYVYAPDRPRRRGSWLESHGAIPRFDLGGVIGFNAPGGAMGIETEFRPVDFVGLGLHGGIGMWGARVSPVLHLYPFGASNAGVYGEASFSFNTGGAARLTIDGAEQVVNLGWAPAAGVGLGLRRQWLKYLWTSWKVGYQWKLGGTNDYTVQGGGTLSAGAQQTLDFMRPGGLVLGASAGIAFF